MINAPQLLTDLKRRLVLLERDLRERIASVPDVKESLQAEWQAARDAKRNAETFESWADQVITQAGVHWLLSCVFLRFIEDNTLVDRPWISGTPDSGRLGLARDRHEAYFRINPMESDREYLLACFLEAGRLPGLQTFFDETHNPVFRLGISGDAALDLMKFWQQQNTDTGLLLHDFTDPGWNTRFLGDLYQDLSEETRKRYALLQTPEFVEEFILDRTLTPAIREFGYREVRMIDPTCGSGHFLLGGFQRLIVEWARAEPTRNRRDVAQKALDAVAGVDLNPFAVAISRFRLLVAALQACDVHRLSEAPDFIVNVAIGDSLLHGRRFGMKETDDMFQEAENFENTGLSHAYASEDLADVQRILGQRYHAVVGNPPYIVVKDAALSVAYRKRYVSCHRQYSLGAPFTERFFELGITASIESAAGFIGLITSNSFMKREFGTKLIEEVLPQLDLTHVIDTAGAFIPGHGTPTVVLFGRNRLPVAKRVRTVMGIKGEPSTPSDPAHGLVWSAILEQIDRAGSESDFISATDTDRIVFSKHPWSVGGGGVGALRSRIEEISTSLCDVGADVGYHVITGEDNCLILPSNAAARLGIVQVRAIGEGDSIRDWTNHSDLLVLWPYNQEGCRVPIADNTIHIAYLWPFRTSLKERKAFGVPVEQKGLRWWDLREVYRSRLKTPLTITFAEIATHNHFVLDRGDSVFKQTAPVIKLPEGTSEDDHLGLLGLLNSSVACFWLQQVCHNKGRPGANTAGADERYEMRYAINASNVSNFPVTAERPLVIAGQIDRLIRELTALQPVSLIASKNEDLRPNRASLDVANATAAQLRRRAIAAQEELDWKCYALYGILPTIGDTLSFDSQIAVEVAMGERAFEIALARRVAAGLEQTTWFERHGMTPITEIPSSWPDAYRRIVKRRIELIERDRDIGLFERPEYKRRWNWPSWESLEQTALRDWLLARLELPVYWPNSPAQPPSLSSTSQLADAVRGDAAFMEMSALYTGCVDFDPGQLVADLVAGEAVPFLPVLRYADAGLRKRAQWENTWALQRREDAGESVGAIPVPPKYQSKDFLKADFWRLRGGLDVPKERWISYPGCERGADGSLVIGWAGWNHLQQATAIAAFYLDMKENEGWPPERLQPLLAGLLELLPWLVQWHNEIDPAYGERMGDYYKGFVAEEARMLGITIDDLREWKPVAAAAKRARKKAAA